jgi:GTPase
LSSHRIDNERILNDVKETENQRFLNLGLGDPCYISALHAEGTWELQARVFKELFPDQIPQDRKAERLRLKEMQKGKGLLEDEPIFKPRGERPLRIAVVGNPNSGKSSLVNQMISEASPVGSLAHALPRSLTSPLAGTTHDTIDTALRWKETDVVLLDTAGITRRARTQRAGLERSSVLWAMKTISTADVNILVIDGEHGVTPNDKRVAGSILDSKSSVIVAVNKSDLLPARQEKLEENVRRQLQFLSWVPVMFVSALRGTNVGALVDEAIAIYRERLVRIPTRKLIELVKLAQIRRPAPSKGHLRLKISFVTQAHTTTPTFVLFVNEPALVHFTYERFLENAIREAYPLRGSPIHILWRKKSGHEKYDNNWRERQ